MNFLGGSLHVGRLFGINIRIHMLFVLWIGYNVLTAGADWRGELSFLAMIFGVVLMHEFGHCFGARSVGGDARNILLWPLGGLAFAEAPMRAWPQFVTVACGPLVNLVFALTSAAVLIGATRAFGVVSPNPFAAPGVKYMTAMWQWYVWQFYWVNLLQLCFNLLPVFPLDGGQLFRTLVWPFVGLRRATTLAAQMGIVGAVLLGILGAMKEQYMLIAIAIFGGMTSFQHYQAARQGWLVEDAAFVVRNPRGGFWSRLFKRRREHRPAAPVEFPRPTPTPNPNPGGWQAQQDERAREDAELDRILKKVSDVGVHSLSYVERQTLERITRERQRTG